MMATLPDTLAHDENGQVIPISQFDYDEIDRLAGLPQDLSGEPEEEFTAEEIARAGAALKKLLEWVWQDGMKNPEGLTIRAIVVCWVFLPHLHALNLTEMAQAFGKHKQSLGRWVDEFKPKFPRITNPHIK